jgi:hypothetical protein
MNTVAAAELPKRTSIIGSSRRVSGRRARVASTPNISITVASAPRMKMISPDGSSALASFTSASLTTKAVEAASTERTPRALSFTVAQPWRVATQA